MKTYKELIQEMTDSILSEMARLGEGGRFKSLVKKIAKKGNVTDPEAVAAAIGRKKYGKEKMTQLSIKGKKKS